MSRAQEERPYISFITAVRNDEYADPGYKKLKRNLHVLSEQCAKRLLAAENILVEWNPDPSKPTMQEILSDFTYNEWFTIRIFSVPSSFHKKWKYHELRPLHPSVAINVGLRRARGEFCVLKTQDTFYDPSLIDFIAQKKLERGKMYRAMRWDISSDVMNGSLLSIEDFLRRCKEQIFIKHGPLTPAKLPFFLPELFTNGCGDFQLMAKEHFFQIRGYPETKDVRAYATDGLVSYAAYGNKIEEVVLEPPQVVYKITHSQLCNTRHSGLNSKIRLYDRFFLKLESKWPFSRLAFWLRLLFGYPQKFYHGRVIRNCERGALVFKFFSSFSWATKFKTSKWGYPNQIFKESWVNKAKWEKHHNGA